MKDKFNIKDYNRLQPTENLNNALLNHKGLLPILLKPFVNCKQYIENIKNNDLYEQINKEEYDIRLTFLATENKDYFRENQLIEWLEENPKFNELLNNSLKKKSKK